MPPVAGRTPRIRQCDVRLWLLGPLCIELARGSFDAYSGRLELAGRSHVPITARLVTSIQRCVAVTYQSLVAVVLFSEQIANAVERKIKRTFDLLIQTAVKGMTV